MTKYPADISVDGEIKEFITQFYILSDTPNVYQEYANTFTSDARAVFGLVTCERNDGKR
jgi:hypothetical protein